MEARAAPEPVLPHPQCVLPAKPGPRRRKRPHPNNAAAPATIANAAACCQSMAATYRESPQPQHLICAGSLPAKPQNQHRHCSALLQTGAAGVLSSPYGGATACGNSRSTPLTVRGYARSMESAAYRHAHRVTYADCTAGNHVYYARYLPLLEAARNEFLRHLGQPFLDWQNQDTLFPVLECHVRYQSPAHYDDLLHIEVWPTLAERVRLNFAYRIVNQTGALILEAETCHACTSLREKPKRLPESLRQSLLPFLRAAKP